MPSPSPNIDPNPSAEKTDSPTSASASILPSNVPVPASPDPVQPRVRNHQGPIRLLTDTNGTPTEYGKRKYAEWAAEKAAAGTAGTATGVAAGKGPGAGREDASTVSETAGGERGEEEWSRFDPMRPGQRERRAEKEAAAGAAAEEARTEKG